MIACVDVDYQDVGAVAACVCFERWNANTPTSESTVQVGDVEPYEPGQFFRRELPCILAVLKSLPDSPQVVIIDGYVWLGKQRPGLGAHLYEALDKQVTVIGVAKTQFAGAEPVAQVTRGRSSVPLFVTAVGIAVADAASNIKAMHGPHRIPTMLKRVDQLCRGHLRSDHSGTTLT